MDVEEAAGFGLGGAVSKIFIREVDEKPAASKIFDAPGRFCAADGVVGPAVEVNMSHCRRTVGLQHPWPKVLAPQRARRVGQIGAWLAPGDRLRKTELERHVVADAKQTPVVVYTKKGTVSYWFRGPI